MSGCSKQYLSMAMLTAVSLWFSACGNDAKETRSGDIAHLSERTNGMTFADDSKLPKCDDSTQGYLVYVLGSKTFKTCEAGTWTTIDTPDPKAQASDPTEINTANFAKAIDLYKKYRRSVFRMTLTCNTAVANPPTSCGPTPNPGVFLGSAFLCGDNVVCTNAHVVSCNSKCYQNFTSVKVEAMEDGKDTLNPDGTPLPPFATITSAAAFRYSSDTTRSIDLAKFMVTGLPAGLAVLPLAPKASKDGITPLQEIMSLSYPLGLQDLYVDIGAVNTPYLGECNTQGGMAGYDCLSAAYDFSTTNDTDHGSSGSPLIDVLTGNVVGVTTAGTDGENANFTWAVDAFRFGTIQ